MLKTQGLKTDVIDSILSSLGSSETELSKILFTNGLNGSFFVDNDTWYLNGIIIHNGEAVQINQLFQVDYWNGGLNSELVYKWFWIFVPKGTSIENLDGAEFGGEIFGRGLALSTNFVAGSPIAIEGGWLQRKNGVGNIFVVAVKAGLSSGSLIYKNANKLSTGFPSITFPKMVFRQNVVMP